MTIMKSKLVHQSINCPWRDVYEFASDPTKIHLWAAGLATGLTAEGDSWIADGGPIGNVKIHFAARNEFGVIDHVVTMPNGMEVYNALRVTPNGTGAEVSFTLLQLPEMSDHSFEEDARLIQADLLALKHLLETQ